MKQEKSSNNPPGGGDYKSFVSVKDASCSLAVGAPTKEWVKLPSPSLMLFQTSTQEVPQNEPTNNSVSKGNAITIPVVNNIMAASVEAGIDKN